METFELLPRKCAKMSLLTSFHAFLNSSDWRVDSVTKFLTSSINEKIDGETPLTRVLQGNKYSFEIVKLLLDYGADVNYRNNDEDSPLDLALKYSRDEPIIEALLQKGGHLDDKAGLYTTYICTALRHGASKRVVKLLLNAGCSPNACKLHDSVLHCATQFPNFGLAKGVLELLIEFGAVIKSSSSRSPICNAFMAGCGAQDIQLLIGNGIALNMCREHNSPWFCATLSHSCSMIFKSNIVKLIHEAGFPMDVLNDYGWSPLHCALLNCNYTTGAIKLMIKELGVQECNSNGSLLHLAVASNYCKLEIVKLLVDAGLGVNKVDDNGEIPLHRAVMSNSSDLLNVLKYLLEQGSAVDLKNVGGFTPLKKLLFSYNVSGSLIKLLLEAGACIDSSMLIFKFKQYNDYNCPEISDTIKILLKFSFLRNIDYQIREFIEYRQDCDEWAEFAAECVKEVRKLDFEILNCKHGLREFVLGSCKHLTYVDAHSDTTNRNFKQFLRIMTNNTFSLFFEDLSAKVDGELLKSQLQNKSVYTTTICGKKKISLDSDSLRWLMRYLSQTDLLNMIIAYQL